MAEIDQLMAIDKQGAGLKKLAQGWFEDRCEQMRKLVQLDNGKFKYHWILFWPLTDPPPK